MSEPSIDLVEYLFRYDPDTGAVYWRRYRGGRRADTNHDRVDENGQWRVVLGHTLYPAAQIAWLLGHGEWPTFPIVHLNGDINDNRLANLARGE
jgi:hypothetical protein